MAIPNLIAEVRRLREALKAMTEADDVDHAGRTINALVDALEKIEAQLCALDPGSRLASAN